MFLINLLDRPSCEGKVTRESDEYADPDGRSLSLNKREENQVVALMAPFKGCLPPPTPPLSPVCIAAGLLPRGDF